MNSLLDAYERPGWSHARVRILIFLLIVGPVIALAAFGYRSTFRDLTQFALLRRDAIAYLSANVLRGRFDRIIEAGVPISEDPALREAVRDERWNDAADLLRNVPRGRITEVERLFLADTSGTLRAEMPALGGVIGTNFAHRDWYQGVSRSWKPYVSNVYKRAAEPQLNVVAVALPIRGDGEAVSGILVMQINLATLLSWTQAIDAGASSHVFFTDRTGKIAAHPRLDPQADIVDYSGVPAVQRALGLERGVDIGFDPVLDVETVFAYQPVIRYGWTAVVAQPSGAAFAARQESVRALMLLYGPVVVLNILLALLVLRFIDTVVSLRQREKLFFESMGEGLLVVDARGRIIVLNPAAEAMLGIPLIAAFGRDFDDAVPVFDAQGGRLPRERRPVFRAIAGEKVSDKVWYRNGAQRHFPATTTATPVRINGAIAGAVMVFRDVTKDEELDRAKREFVSMASHQLLTPVAAAKGYLSMFLEEDFGKLTDDQREYIGRLFHINQRMIDLVNDLLNLSRVELGVFDDAAEPVDVAQFVRGEVAVMDPLIRTKRISLEAHYPPKMPPLALSSRLLRIIVQNLLSNAVKYTPKQGRVELTVEWLPRKAKSGTLRLTVADNGYGIPEDAQKKIYEKFYRAENVKRAGVEGTGLGLYIVKSVVDILKGTIHFTSAEGTGTTFTVEIPARPHGPTS